jgi:hypothetical protein
MDSGSRLGKGLGGVQCLDHHPFLALVCQEKPSTLQYCLHGFQHLVEATGRTTLLRKASDAKLRFLAMLNDGHNLGSKGNLLKIEIYSMLAASPSRSIIDTYNCPKQLFQRRCCDPCRPGYLRGRIASTL